MIIIEILHCLLVKLELIQTVNSPKTNTKEDLESYKNEMYKERQNRLFVLGHPKTTLLINNRQNIYYL